MNEASKIREAEFFLERIVEASDDPDATRYYASAFLTAARSVLQYALKEAKSKSDGQGWYLAQVKTDPVVEFLRDGRDINVHHRPLPMQTNITIHVPAGVVTLGSTNVIPPSPPEDGSTSTYDYKFKGWPGSEDLLTLCRRYLGEIRRIVADGRKKGVLSL